MVLNFSTNQITNYQILINNKACEGEETISLMIRVEIVAYDKFYSMDYVLT